MGWASKELVPIKKRSSALYISSKLTQAAPVPTVAASPATDGACQTRAGLSTLFVLKIPRAIFCMR